MAFLLGISMQTKPDWMLSEAMIKTFLETLWKLLITWLLLNWRPSIPGSCRACRHCLNFLIHKKINVYSGNEITNWVEICTHKTVRSALNCNVFYLVPFRISNWYTPLNERNASRISEQKGDWLQSMERDG